LESFLANPWELPVCEPKKTVTSLEEIEAFVAWAVKGAAQDTTVADAP
jgi:hypothetical protein